MLKEQIASLFPAHRRMRRCENDLLVNPRNISAWVELIELMKSKDKLSKRAATLVDSHEIKKTGHAVHVFSEMIANRAGKRLDALSRSPIERIEDALDEIVKWKTAIQCGHTHDVSKGYFTDAESVIEYQWNNIIYPIIKDFDFTEIVDLACGHGRNTEYLSRLSNNIHLVDINQSCIDACRDRFKLSYDTVRFHYHLTDGNHMRMIESDTITLVYSWDSMVHFDKLIVKDYLFEVSRILKNGGIAFLHHSNYGEFAPDSDWAKNAGTRSDMSARLMRDYAENAALEVVDQKLQGRAEGWGQDELDCVSILRKVG